MQQLFGNKTEGTTRRSIGRTGPGSSGVNGRIGTSNVAPLGGMMMIKARHDVHSFLDELYGVRIILFHSERLAFYCRVAEQT